MIRSHDFKICFNSTKKIGYTILLLQVKEYHNGINLLISDKQEPNIVRRTIQLYSKLYILYYSIHF